MRFLMSMALIFSLAFFSLPSVHACSCVGAGTVHQERKKARAIFVGEVVEVYSGSGDKDYPVIVEFKVERYWKGIKTSKIDVLSDYGTLSCPYSGILLKGERYIVYAYGKKLKVRGCTRTNKIENAAEDLRELGDAKLPVS